MPLGPTALTTLDGFSGTAERTSDGSPLQTEVVALFDQFRDRLLRYLLSFGLPVADGEEIIQEVFLSLFQHLQRGKSRENLPGWLFRVAHNMALKRRYRLQRGIEVSGGGTSHQMDVHENSAVDPSPTPEDQLLQSERQQRMRAVVDALPEQDRRCLFLRAEGLRYREITGILDMSLGSVSMSLARSLARIARAVER